MKKKKKSLIKKLISFIIILGIITVTAFSYLAYKVIHKPNVKLEKNETTFFYIPTGSTYKDVLHLIKDNDLIKNHKTFEWLADKKNLKNNINPGRYKIIEGMGNNELINMLRSGQQKPVRLSFSNINSLEQLAGIASERIEADSLSIITTIHDEKFIPSLGFENDNIKLMFLPNTYEFYWNTSAEAFIRRMHREYNSFWNEKRREKAKQINMTPAEVGILASIIQLETNREEEFPRIAGVYINRLNRGMLLQADPTVIFALGDPSVRRVLNRHLAIDSPYNTYKFRGLPPGPISFPEPKTIDSVLNYEKHNYLFFSAKADFSGYHNFSKTYSEHLANAREYHQALNKKRILN